MGSDEAIVQELAVKMGCEGPTLVNLKSETYPETKHFSYKRFTVQSDQHSINLLLKKAQTDSTLREALSIKRKLQNEVSFYSQVVPKIRPILEKMKENETTQHKLFLPDYYGHGMTEGKEWLAIEDLSSEFKGVSDAQNLDKEHLKATVQALGAFHSASINWKVANSADYQAAAKSFCEMEMIHPDEDSGTDMKSLKVNTALVAATKACSTHLTVPYTTSLDKVCKSVKLESLLWVSAERSEPWSVITHGDCWAKNFLYKYDKNKKISGVAMVDFKYSRVGSPVLDVSHFLLSSASSECLKDLRPFIEKHKDSMTPKLTDYRSHMHQFGAYGLVSALTHHYFDVVYPNMALEEAIRRIEIPDQAELYDSDKTKDTKKSAVSIGRDIIIKEAVVSSEKRVVWVVKAAHDVRMI